ncbi:MAG TPA: hypothetical protein VKA21_01190, partial [Candidatus Binatia bacterium]|nr:hypothetical protein [Candidatus Binatia bacterium]
TSTVPPPRVIIPHDRLGSLAPFIDGDLVVPVRFRTLNRRPPRGLEDGGVGARLGGTLRDVDWDLYHYTGPETGPDADLVVDVLHPPGMPPGSYIHPRAEAFLHQAHDVIHMTGADASMVLGGFTLRAEAAHFVDRPYLRVGRDVVAAGQARIVPERVVARFGRHPRRLRFRLHQFPDLFPSLDSVEWGLGADYLIHGWQPLLQLNQIVLLDEAPRLLIGDPETRLTGTLRKRVLGDRLELEVRALYALERGGWFAFPRVSYDVRDDLRVRLGYFMIGGPRTSLLGQFGRNDEVVIQARYSF